MFSEANFHPVAPNMLQIFMKLNLSFLSFFFLFIILLIVSESSFSCVSRISENASSSQKVLQMLENSCYSPRYFDLLAY